VSPHKTAWPSPESCRFRKGRSIQWLACRQLARECCVWYEQTFDCHISFLLDSAHSEANHVVSTMRQSMTLANEKGEVPKAVILYLAQGCNYAELLVFPLRLPLQVSTRFKVPYSQHGADARSGRGSLQSRLRYSLHPERNFAIVLSALVDED